MKQPKIVALFTASLILFSSYFAFGLSVKTLSLQQIVSLSDLVFRGTLIDSQIQNDTEESGHVVEYFTFSVDECLKGDCGQNVTYKQIVLSHNSMPRFQKGVSYVLFLPEASEQTGLTAPVGIWQGRYELSEKNGQLLVPALSKGRAVVKSLGLKSTKALGVSADFSYATFKEEINTAIELSK